MLIRDQVSPDWVEVKSTTIAKGLVNLRAIKNTELIQITHKPPELPIEGRKQKRSNRLGQHNLTKFISKDSHLVSCRHTIEQPESSTALKTASCFSEELTPRMFQHRTFHVLFGCIMIRLGVATCHEPP